MKSKNRVAAAVLGLAALGLSSPQGAVAKSPLEGAEKGKRQCFWTSQVNNFAAENDRVVNVRVGVREVYRLEIFGTCPEIDWTQKIALVSRHGSSICSGLDAEIVTPSAIGPQRCTVRNIRKLTPAEVETLPRKARP
ncbi:DUF6491 family protein [Phenylobacterium sp.]|uniref:DUF6491 family protein n=1 Tax=Phenylobacterium sp. TaxID=1871053 RepID=UPI0028115236|nr:DUF6491 family protein [Phenylobacterium sp.]